MPYIFRKITSSNILKITYSFCIIAVSNISIHKPAQKGLCIIVS